MLKINFFLLLLLSNLQLSAQNEIVIGSIDTIHSEILHENRKIWIHVPKNTKDKYYQKKYPVVYVLDGDEHFHSLTGLIHQLSKANDNKILPEMIVVSILNTDRTRDLTPTKVVPKEMRQHDYFKQSGGGEKFIAFLERELIPYIDKKYPTEPHRIFIGHSLGGLLTVHTLVYHPDLFNSYVAIDPSLSADNTLAKNADSICQSNKFENKSLFIAIANTKDVGMDSAQAQKDSSGMTEHFRAIVRFCKKRQSETGTLLNFKYKYYPDEGHAGVPLIAEYDALRFLFSWYELKLDIHLIQKFQTWKVDELMKYFKGHYETASNHLGYKVSPSEDLVKELADAALNEGEEYYDKAFAFYQLNIDNYPTSPKVHYSMGNYYLKAGNQKKAIECFEKSLSLEDSEKTRKKLEEAKAKKKKGN